MDTLGPTKTVQFAKVYRSLNMIKCHLGSQLLSVWIMLMSLFSSVHINRFRCNHTQIVNITYH